MIANDGAHLNIKDRTDWVKKKAIEYGFDDVGITKATEGTPYASQFLDSIAEGRHGPLQYMSGKAEIRADIQKLLPGAQSVVMLVKNYYTGDHNKFVSRDRLEKGAKVSRYGWGGDYHHWFKKRLRKLRKEFQEAVGAPALVHIFNDTGPVLERAWAQKAGLGFVGKSAMFIHRKYGTWTFLGGFVTDIELAADKPYPMQHCGSCTACIDACPTDAIHSANQIDARKCITTWNVERPLHETANGFTGHGWGVGCDICQEVCPWNKFEQETEEPRFLPRPKNVVLDANDLPEDLRGTPLARPGKEGLLLNIHRARPVSGLIDRSERL